jgi:hypothetical protein
MAISNNSTGLRPGVCTSTTRPTAPYEGQMIYETDTDLTYVWGGSAWQQVSGGTAVGNSGLVYVGQTTAGSGVTTLTLNNVFSATYNAYRVVVGGGSISAAASLSMQVIDSGGTASTASYYESFIYSAFTGSTVLAANTNNGSNFVRTANAISSSDCATGAFDLVNPFLSKFTHYYNSANPGGGNGGNSIGYHGVASSYTGIKLTSSVASALTGTIVTVYGYRLG